MLAKCCIHVEMNEISIDGQLKMVNLESHALGERSKRHFVGSNSFHSHFFGAVNVCISTSMCTYRQLLWLPQSQHQH